MSRNPNPPWQTQMTVNPNPPPTPPRKIFGDPRMCWCVATDCVTKMPITKHGFFFNSIYGVGNNFSIFCVVYFNSLLLWVELKVIWFFLRIWEGEYCCLVIFQGKKYEYLQNKSHYVALQYCCSALL